MDIPVRKILEAATTQAISQISYDERVAIADLYEEITGNVGKPLCNGCLIQMCTKIINSGYYDKEKNEIPKPSKQKEGNTRRGRGKRDNGSSSR